MAYIKNGHILNQFNSKEMFSSHHPHHHPSPAAQLILQDHENVLINPYATIMYGNDSVMTTSQQSSNLLTSSAPHNLVDSMPAAVSVAAHAVYGNVIGSDVVHQVTLQTNPLQIVQCASQQQTAQQPMQAVGVVPGGGAAVPVSSVSLVNSQEYVIEEMRSKPVGNTTSSGGRDSQMVKPKVKVKGDKPFECETCFRRFNQKQTLKQHILTHTGQRPFECNVCFKTFTQQGALQRHMVIHTGEKPFQCTYCELSFRQKINLKRHMKLHTGAPKEFRCTICSREFSRKGARDRHVTIHDQDRPVVRCSCCNKSFLNRESVFRHERAMELREKGLRTGGKLGSGGGMKRKCAKSGTGSGARKVEKCFIKCANCLRLFRRVKTILSLTTGTISTMCLRCLSNNEETGSTMKTAGIVRETEIFQCSVCQAIFQKRASFEKHKLLHCASRKYECDVCHLRFKEKRFIRGHMLKHIDTCEHQCHLCGLNFKYASKLKAHYLTHINEIDDISDILNVFTCYTCGRVFYQRNQLIRHLKVHEKQGENGFLQPSERKSGAVGVNISKGEERKCLNTRSLSDAKRGFVMNGNDVINAYCNVNETMTASGRELSRQSEANERNRAVLPMDVEHVDQKGGFSLKEVHRRSSSTINESSLIVSDVRSLKEEKEELITSQSDEAVLDAFVDISFNGKTEYVDEAVNDVGDADDNDTDDGHDGFFDDTNMVSEADTGVRRGPSLVQTTDAPIVEEEYTEERQKTHPFFCYICKKSYTQKRSLNRHFQVSHTNYDKFPCADCGKRFQTKNSLKQHRVVHLPHAFHCSMCDKTFNRKDALASHELIHSEEKSFHCSYCPKSFFQKQSLHTHLIQHRGEKSFECGVCGKCFYERSTLNRHYLSHSGERKYSCHVCNMSFIQKNHLDKHFLRHDEIEKKVTFPCDRCEKVFYRKDHCARHKESHETVRALSACPRCGATFTHKYSLARHLKQGKCPIDDEG